jgi:hypothetical protein
MTKPLLAILLLLPLLAQGGEKRVLGSASYKDVCANMAAAGITSRTQTTPTTDSITDNVLVVSGLDDLNQSRENRLVSNTKIFVGANVTGVSTYTSNSTRPSASQADPCASVRDAKTPEVTLPTPEAEPSPAPNVSWR